MKMAAAHVPDEIIEALDQIATAHQVERTKVIRWALVDYIQRSPFVRPVEGTNAPSDVQTPIDQAA